MKYSSKYLSVECSYMLSNSIVLPELVHLPDLTKVASLAFGSGRQLCFFRWLLAIPHSTLIVCLSFNNWI